MRRLRLRCRQGFFLTTSLGRKTKAQATLEYAVIIVCIIAALLGMQVYLKRALQGRLRQEADDLGEQYAPKNTTGDSLLTYTSNTYNKVANKSEAELQLETGRDIDLDGDKVYNEEDVFGTETISYLGGWPVDTDGDGTLDSSASGSNTTQVSTETVGPLEASLFPMGPMPEIPTGREIPDDIRDGIGDIFGRFTEDYGLEVATNLWINILNGTFEQGPEEVPFDIRMGLKEYIDELVDSFGVESARNLWLQVLQENS